MRQPLSPGVVVLLLACAVPALGEDRRFEVSAFVAPAGSYSDYDGFDFDTGFGAGFGWRFAPHWAAEGRFLLRNGDSSESETYQLGLRYAFLEADARWRPFVVAGLHQQRIERRHEVVCLIGPCPDLEQTFDDSGLFAGGGVDWQLSDGFGLRFDGRLLVYDSELYDDVEEDAELTAGAVFRF